jgi:hypothetical protein
VAEIRPPGSLRSSSVRRNSGRASYARFFNRLRHTSNQCR